MLTSEYILIGFDRYSVERAFHCLLIPTSLPPPHPPRPAVINYALDTHIAIAACGGLVPLGGRTAVVLDVTALALVRSATSHAKSGAARANKI